MTRPLRPYPQEIQYSGRAQQEFGGVISRVLPDPNDRGASAGRPGRRGFGNSKPTSRRRVASRPDFCRISADTLTHPHDRCSVDASRHGKAKRPRAGNLDLLILKTLSLEKPSTAGPLPSVSSRFRVKFCRCSRASAIRHCTDWSSRAGSRLSGHRAKRAARPSSTR